MSVFVGSSTTAPVSPRPPQVPAVTSVVLSSAGGRVELMQAPWKLLAGSTGLTGPTSTPDLGFLPGVDGGYLRGEDQDNAGLTTSPLDMLLRVSIVGASPAEVAARIAEVRRVLNSRRYGPTTLRVGRGGGAIRTITVKHTPAQDDFAWDFGLSRAVVLLRLLAPSPLWRGSPGEAGPWGLSSGGGGRTPANLPFHLAASTVLGEENPVTVRGDEITWPTLRFWGPLTSVTVERTLHGRTRGYTLVHPVGLAAGAQLTIRHDPTAMLAGGRPVEGPGGGASWSRFLQPGADLFELVPGDQGVRVLVGGAQPGVEASVSWDSLYWSALDG